MEATDDKLKDSLFHRSLKFITEKSTSESKADSYKGFRADKIMDQIHQYISASDIQGLQEYWSHLDQTLFVGMDISVVTHIRKLHNSIFRIYLATAAQAGRFDKVNEFFDKVTHQLPVQADWREWYTLQNVKNPEEHPQLALFFSRQWQDTVFLSLHNFLSLASSMR